MAPKSVQWRLKLRPGEFPAGCTAVPKIQNLIVKLYICQGMGFISILMFMPYLRPGAAIIYPKVSACLLTCAIICM